MTAELNQRVSYYTGVKLIRHHQNQNQSGNSTNNSTASPSNPGPGGSSVITPNGYYPLHGHHPGHFHLPCPTGLGPPRIQHPGGMPYLGNHHGPPHHPHTPGHHQFGPGGGSNQATRLYAGSPLIRSSAFHSMNGNSGNHKRSYKHHNRGHHVQNGHYHNGHNGNKFGASISNQSHHPGNIIIGGSCSSGTSSSSSSNEHLNSFQSPTGSPTATTKLDITALKLSSSPPNHGISSTSSSSNNSSPSPEGSPSPSSAPSASPSSSDGNKDLDHFYFLDEHWKPTTDETNIQSNNGGTSSGSSSTSGDVLDNMSSSTNSIRSSHWASSSSGSPSPPASNNSAALTMMVDQFFATRDNNNSLFNLVDANNNIIGGTTMDLNQVGRHPRGDHQDLFHSFNTSGNNCTGASGLFNFGGANNNSNNNIDGGISGGAATVVNVETQIGTFNGQRDLEIRLCFIKGDHHTQRGTVGAVDSTKFNDSRTHEIAYMSKPPVSVNHVERTMSVVGDPFSTKTKTNGNELGSANCLGFSLPPNQNAGRDQSSSTSDSIDLTIFPQN